MSDFFENGDQENKTEEPTEKRFEEFRKEGKVAQSKEFTAIFLLISCTIVIYFSSSRVFGEFLNSVKWILSNISNVKITKENVELILFFLFKSVFIAAFPAALAGFFSGIFGNIVQIGFNFSFKPLKMDFSKINPLKRINKMFSMNSLVEGGKSVFKIILIGFVTYLMIAKSIMFAPNFMDLDIHSLLVYVAHTGFQTLMVISGVLLLISIFDFIYQKYQFRKQLMMTRKQVKDELREREGDPLLKARIRAIQREMARNRMMEEVPEADVVITNPTHIAVAIKYESSQMEAPKVVAKGADHIAQKIKSIAEKTNVPMVENVFLARALHKNIEVGQYIPRSLYKAVAEVLAYIYRLRGTVPELGTREV